MGYSVVMDIGGTFIKSALADDATHCIVEQSIYSVPTNAEGSAKDFFSSLENIVQHARTFDHHLSAASVCIPGPFDYERGISQMQHKFQSIYMQSVTPFFASQGLSVVYLHDSTAFLLGEMRFGSAKGFSAPLGIMLGTGFGFSIASDHAVLISEDQRPSVKMWNKQYREGIVEDYVSSRALRASYKELKGLEAEIEVKEIGEKADSGDPLAQQVFEKVGSDIGLILQSYIPSERYDCIVLGGQIARSHQYIIPSLAAKCSAPVFCSQHILTAALWGAAAYLYEGKESCVKVASEEAVLGPSTASARARGR